MALSSHADRDAARKDDVIQIRVSAGTKAILSRAARLRGQKLSEFMLDSARKQAEETILDQRIFFLDADAHEKFLDLLDAPNKPTEELRARMTRKPAWER
ncbi:putative DNA-binding protein [Mesorhizobium sp. ORS 3324]|nr:putative DNA-binding protein [Mesorhizobium sp. ORS 3324]